MSRGTKPYVGIAGADGGAAKNVSASVHGFPGYDNARIITLLRAPVGTKEEVGADGVIHVVPDPEGGKEVESIELDVSAFGDARFYDIRRGRALECRAGKLAIDMRAGDGLPIAALDYAPVRFVAGATKVEEGGRTLSVTWKLAGLGNGQLPPHVVRLDVIDGATGKADPALSGNFVSGKDGGGRLEIPLALEDEGRELQVRIRDVLTGTVWVPPGTADAVQRKPVEPERPDRQEPVAEKPVEAATRRRGTPRTPGPGAGWNGTVIALAAAALAVVTVFLIYRAFGKRRRRNQQNRRS